MNEQVSFTLRETALTALALVLVGLLKVMLLRRTLRSR